MTIVPIVREYRLVYAACNSIETLFFAVTLHGKLPESDHERGKADED
jgi:hypothetical protein